MRERVVPEFDGETYLMWEERQRDRFELHHGFVVTFAGGTLDNDRIALNVRVAFDRLFAPPCRSFGSDVKVRVADNNYHYSDAGVVCGDVPGHATVVVAPIVVAEVLCPITRAYDLIDKRAAYRGLAGLEAYLIVHTDRRYLELDLRASGGTWSTTTVEDGAPGIPLGNATLELADVYERTMLAPLKA